MKDYIRDVFRYFDCEVRETEKSLAVTLSPEFAQSFGKKALQLVFRPEDMRGDTELVTYGSYLNNTLYDLLKSSGKKVALRLPKRVSTEGAEQEIRPWQCKVLKRSSREIHSTEVFLTFRIAYYSNEKQEELITIGCDVHGKLMGQVEFPYPASLLGETKIIRFPYTKKQSKAIYERCLEFIEKHARQQAFEHQQELAARYHQDVMRLEGFYRQMIEEIPEPARDREAQAQQLQQEYEQKATEELRKCHIQVSVEPISFCAVSIPFSRSRYVLSSDCGKTERTHVTVDSFYNLFSGSSLYPVCASCKRDMRELGICKNCGQAVCRDCLHECHGCGALVCSECGNKTCAECGEWSCPTCSEECHLCGGRFCAKHLLGCRECRRHVCPNCREECAECHGIVGNIHIRVCDLSHAHVCLNCTVTCPCCDKHVAQSQAHSCGFCGRQMCEECSFRCEVCDELFCVHHVTECEISGSMTCPQHSAVCTHCSRRISAAHTHPCDVCRKKACDECSATCQSCGISFCKEHADEMSTCPECGKLYCALCYSGQGLCSSCRTANA